MKLISLLIYAIHVGAQDVELYFFRHGEPTAEFLSGKRQKSNLVFENMEIIRTPTGSRRWSDIFSIASLSDYGHRQARSLGVRLLRQNKKKFDPGEAVFAVSNVGVTQESMIDFLSQREGHPPVDIQILNCLQDTSSTPLRVGAEDPNLAVPGSVQSDPKYV